MRSPFLLFNFWIGVVENSTELSRLGGASIQKLINKNKNMDEFNIESKCPACGSSGAKVKYIKKFICEFFNVEDYMLRTCENCGKEWAEKPLNK